MSDTSGAIRSAELMIAQMERDTKRAAQIGDRGMSMKEAPFSWQGNILRGSLVAKAWRHEGRQTLAIHPGLVDEVRLASSSAFPLNLLRALPYLNPMVIYAEPPVIDSWRMAQSPEQWARYEEKAMRLVGFFTHGSLLFHERLSRTNFPTQEAAIRWVRDDITTTHDPEAEALGLVCVFEILDPAGRTIDIEVSSFSIPLEGETTLGELVTAQADRFAFSSDYGMTDARRTWIREVYQIILGSVLYLCSTTLETEKVPTSATRHLVHTVAKKPLNLYRVGWTLGAALSRYRRERTGDGFGPRRGMQEPQHRKCHFRMQWYGSRGAKPCMQMRGTCPCEGRHREWIFIAPYWTHRELLDETGVTTVRSVT